MKPPSKIYSAPGYVSAFRMGGLLCVALGIVALGLSLAEQGSSVWPGVGLMLAGLANFLYADMADALAHTRWQVELLAYQLGPVIDEINTQGSQREKREREARAAQEAEIRRVVEGRLGISPGEDS